MAEESQVIVVGAGPGGLMLAGELALAGVSCTVLERRPSRSAQSRALGLQPRTLELLDLREQARQFTSLGHPLDHYRLTVGPARLDLHRLDTCFRQLCILPQSRTEELLEKRAARLGTRVIRNVEVLKVSQGAESVTVQVADSGRTGNMHARWVVGCDGSHSAVRESLGVRFSGKTYPYNVVVGDVRLAAPPRDGMLVQVGRSGLVVAIDFGTGWWRMGAVNWDRPEDARAPVTVGELGQALAAIFGRDLGPHDPLWMSRFRFQNRQASRWRVGRVLLLGDAAHVHAPLGAQGLNMSMQDAMNLGWKLGAVCRGDAPQALLDTYERERRPVATKVLRASDAAIRTLMSRQLPVRAARRVIIPAVTGSAHGHQLLAGYVSGLSWAYRTARARGKPAIVGCRVPDARLRTADGKGRRLFECFHHGRFVLIEQAGNQLAAAVKPWTGKVIPIAGRIEDRPALAGYDGILVRPDGYCAWAGGPEDTLSLRATLRDLCGEPEPGAVTR